jgi:DNA polymerase
MVSYAILETGDVAVGTIEEMLPEIEQICKDPSIQCWAANSNFDQGWTEHLGVTSARDWKCILDRAAAAQLPRHLAGLAKTLLGIKIDKTVRDEMSGVHYADMPKERQDETLAYCLTDSVEESRCLEKLLKEHPTPSIEEDIAAMTRWQNRRGLYVDMDLVDEDLTAMQESKWTAGQRVPWSSDVSPLSTIAFRDWCKASGIPAPRSVAKDDPECAALCAQYPELAKVVSAIQSYRSVNGFIEKAEAVKRRVREDGHMPLDLLYCGAPHTRRWSSQGVNVQNLPRDPLEFPIGADEVVEIMPRNWLTPAPGNIFLILDYSQIEPRVLHWLTGNQALLDLLTQGYPLYEAFARQWGQWNDEMEQAAGDLPLKKADLGLYTKTKNKVLGLGYGMGWSKYSTYGGQNLEAEVAKADVKMFRETNKGVTDLWGQLDKALNRATLSADKTLELHLPSGEIMRHFNCKKTATHGIQTLKVKGEFRGNNITSRVWGGFLTENLVQRVARDIMAYRAAECWRQGLPVRFTSHDEVIVEVKDDSSKMDALVEMARILRTPPVWAEGIPLAVEGGFASRYVKEPEPVDIPL